MCVGHPWHCTLSSIFISYTENDFCHSFLLMIQYDIGVKHLSLTRLFIFSGVAGLIFLLKEVIKLANYGLELRKSAFDTGQKCCTFDVQNSPYNLYHVIDPHFFFLLNATFLAYSYTSSLTIFGQGGIIIWYHCCVEPIKMQGIWGSINLVLASFYKLDVSLWLTVFKTEVY